MNDHAKAMDLLARANAYFADYETAPDDGWCREYLLLTRCPAICSEEGWEPLESAEQWLRDYPDWTPEEILLFDANGDRIENATLAHVLAEVARRKAAKGQAPSVTVTTFADASDLLAAAGEGGGK